MKLCVTDGDCTINFCHFEFGQLLELLLILSFILLISLINDRLIKNTDGLIIEKYSVLIRY